MEAWTLLYKDQNGFTPQVFTKFENFKKHVLESIREEAKLHDAEAEAEELIEEWGDELEDLMREWEEKGREIGFKDNYEKAYVCKAQIMDLENPRS